MLAEELTLPLLQSALRAGVRDVIAIDAGESQIRQAIERVGDAMSALVNRAAAAAEPKTLGTVITAFSTKGGVGKSVVATNLAVVLATHAPGRVVLVDSDLQFGDVAVLLGIPPLSTTTDAAAAIETADEQLMDGLLATHEASGLRVLCAPVEPSAGDKITPEEMVGTVSGARRQRVTCGYASECLPWQTPASGLSRICRARDAKPVLAQPVQRPRARAHPVVRSRRPRGPDTGARSGPGPATRLCGRRAPQSP